MSSMKKYNVSLKMDSAEFKELERICKLLNLGKSEYLRAVAFGAPAPTSTPTQPAETAPAPDFSFLQADIDLIKQQQEELKQQQQETAAALAQSAESFNTLLDYLNQYIRVPSFREYRARDAVEGTIQKPGETELAFLLRLANRYYILYKTWPNAADINTFGKIANEETKANFPKAPRI